jgi:hypothetical protein
VNDTDVWHIAVMPFYDIAQEIMDEFRLNTVEFAAKAGIVHSTVYGWKSSPDKLPARKTLYMIEDAFSIEFERDVNGDITGWHKREQENAEMSEKITRDDLETRVKNTYRFPKERFQRLINSARGMYDMIEMYGGKADWDDLPPSLRHKIELIKVERDNRISALEKEAELVFEQASVKMVQLLVKEMESEE